MIVVLSKQTLVCFQYVVNDIFSPYTVSLSFVSFISLFMICFSRLIGTRYVLFLLAQIFYLVQILPICNILGK